MYLFLANITAAFWAANCAILTTSRTIRVCAYVGCACGSLAAILALL